MRGAGDRVVHTDRYPRLAAAVAGATEGRVIGVEREYSLEGPGGVVDARTMWPGTTALGVAFDPGDINARRGAWGGVVTVDGAEAEVVTPPVALRPGCAEQVTALAAAGTRHLMAALPTGLSLRGYSTHLNIEVDDRRVVGVARIVAHRLALPLMLALDRADSPGLLVRPRRGRLELGGEFCAGDSLRAAIGIAVGVTLLAERATGVGRMLHRLPELPRARVVPAVERYGFFVDRRAFGPDLYRTGRATVLTARGRPVTAGLVLRRAWEAARTIAGTVLGDGEVSLVDAVVSGAAPIPLESGGPPEDAAVPTVSSDRTTVPPNEVTASYDYRPHRRGGLTVTVQSATWWRALLRIDAGDDVRWVTIPGRALDAVLHEVDSGRLDGELAGIVARPTACRPLPAAAAASEQ